MNGKTLEPLGNHLRTQREKVGLQLGDIANKTKISMHILQSLEAGDEGGLPAPVFVKGFLRNIALEIGLDPLELIQEYKSLTAGRADEVTVPVPVMARKPEGPGSYFWAAILVVLLILGGLGWGGYYYFFQYGQSGAPVEPAGPVAAAPATETAPEATPAPQSEPATADEATETDKPDQGGAPAQEEPSQPAVTDSAPETSPTASAGAADTASKPADSPAPADGHELKMIFDRETWVQVVIDDEKTLHGLYAPGMSESWKAKESFQVRVGNAGGVRVFFDGEAMPPLGEEGRVVTLTLPQASQP